MEPDLWVKAHRQDEAWEIADQQVPTPERPQPQPLRLAARYAGAAERGIPQLDVC